MYYSAIGLLAIIVLLIVNHDILLNRGDAFRAPAWKVYRRFLFAVLVYYITDVLWGILEDRKLAALLFADTTVYFAAMAAAVLLLGALLLLLLKLLPDALQLWPLLEQGVNGSRVHAKRI